jgi:putative ABC transport system permease protein
LRDALGASASVNMMVSGSAVVTARGDTTQHATQVQALLGTDARMSDSLLLAGRFFSEAEATAGAPVVTISQRLAADFAKGRHARDVVGDTLLFQGQPRVVVGVLKASESDRSRRAVMPALAVKGAVVASQLDRPAQLVVTSSTVEGVKPTRERIETWAASQFGPSWKERVSIISDETRLEQVQKGLLLFKLFMGALMSISLIVGGIGIMNVLLSSVIERTREIGIRKATGAAQRDILWQFLCESVAITGVGSMIGLVLGVGAAFAVTALMRKLANAPIQAWLSVSTVLVAIGASVIVGLAFGLYPAMRAAKLSPIDAIHHE